MNARTVRRSLAVLLCWAVFCAAAIESSSATSRPGALQVEEPVPASGTDVDLVLRDPFETAGDEDSVADAAAIGESPWDEPETMGGLSDQLVLGDWAPLPGGKDPFSFWFSDDRAFSSVGMVNGSVRGSFGGGVIDVPPVVLAAYLQAERLVADVAPGCQVPWYVLAGIGRVESGHGMHHGAATVVGTDGSISPHIIGLPLNGSTGVANIADSDGGVWDGDRIWDRAVGPMQFIPSSWRRHGQDGNGDGIADPHNVYDATLAAVSHLCASVNGDLSKPQAMARAIYGYNHSSDYVALVMRYASSYAAIDPDAAQYVAIAPAGGGVTSEPTWEAPGRDVAVLPPTVVEPDPDDQPAPKPHPRPDRVRVSPDDPPSQRLDPPPEPGDPKVGADPPEGDEPLKHEDDPMVSPGPEPKPDRLKPPKPPERKDPGPGPANTPEPVPTASDAPTEYPEAEPEPEPVPTASDMPTEDPQPQPEPTATAVPEPTTEPEPTEQPDAREAPTPAPDPTAEPTATPTTEPTERAPEPEPTNTRLLLPSGTGRGTVPTPCVDLRALVGADLDAYNATVEEPLAWQSIAITYEELSAVALSVYAVPRTGVGATPILWAEGTVNCRTGAFDLTPVDGTAQVSAHLPPAARLEDETPRPRHAI